MNCRRAGIKGTTAGILTTLAAIGTGVTVTLWKAAEVASQCKSYTSFFGEFGANSFSLPSNATVIFNGITTNVTLLLDPISLTTILGNATLSAMKETPDVISDICYNATVASGVAFTAILASGILFFTCYHKTNAEIKKLNDQLAEKNNAKSDDQPNFSISISKT